MGTPFGDTRYHGQYIRKSTIARACGDIEADDVMHLIIEQRITGKLERLGTVRLQAKCGPCTTDGGM